MLVCHLLDNNTFNAPEMAVDVLKIWAIYREKLKMNLPEPSGSKIRKN
jgi:hypothetical protein